MQSSKDKQQPDLPLTDAQRAMVATYYDRARKTAKRAYSRIPDASKAYISESDLHSVAMIALCKASLYYDSARGQTFWTYAVGKIQGAFLHLLRDESPVPRAHQNFIRKLGDHELSYGFVCDELARLEKQQKMTWEAKVSLQGTMRRYCDRRTQPSSLDAPKESWSTAFERLQKLGDTVASHTPGPEQEAIHNFCDLFEFENERLEEAIRQLHDHERTVLRLFMEGKSKREIACETGKDELHVRRTYDYSLHKIRKYMKKAVLPERGSANTSARGHKRFGGELIR